MYTEVIHSVKNERRTDVFKQAKQQQQNNKNNNEKTFFLNKQKN